MGYIYIYIHNPAVADRSEGVFLRFFYVSIMFYAIYGTWEAHASSRHTNLARRIDPPTPKHPKSSKLEKLWLSKIIFSDPFVIRFLFSIFL